MITNGRRGRISPLRAQRERLYKIMRRATTLTVVPGNLAHLRSPAWARYNAIMEEAYGCKDVERLKVLLGQAGDALDDVKGACPSSAPLTSRGARW